MSKLALVADIGGTNARFALADIDALTVRRPENFRAADFETPVDAARAYIEAAGERPELACFAVAGPVGGVDRDDEITFTNSHWKFRPSEIRAGLHISRFEPVNDFFALASSVYHLPSTYLVDVKGGAPIEDAPTLVIGPGTGLGQAIIVPAGGSRRVIATEGGHVSFAPRTEIEIAIMQFIAREHPRVSVERLLSGRGLVNIHRALCSIEGAQRASLQAGEITAAAISGEYPIAVKAVEMFCAILGRVAGDAVLATGARGGVVLGGGILPKIREFFLESSFVERFTDKGRMTDYVTAVPVRLIINDTAALIGAAAALRERL